jgi:hypothetical protein
VAVVQVVAQAKQVKMVDQVAVVQQAEHQEPHLLQVKVTQVALHLVVDMPLVAVALEALEVLHLAKTSQAAVA